MSNEIIENQIIVFLDDDLRISRRKAMNYFDYALQPQMFNCADTVDIDII